MTAYIPVGDVPRQTARHQKDHVEGKDVPVVARAACEPEVGRAADACRLARRDRGLGILARQVALHLDEGEALSPNGDNVDLACPRLHAPAEDAVALGNQHRRRERLRYAAAPQPHAPLGGAGGKRLTAERRGHSLVRSRAKPRS